MKVHHVFVRSPDPHEEDSLKETFLTEKAAKKWINETVKPEWFKKYYYIQENEVLE